jgi:hypothetical protein
VHTWRPDSEEIGDTLAGYDRASLEMHIEGCVTVNLEAIIDQVWRCTLRP